jgi:predicted DNA-binding transcriptional regulator AlpA
MSTTAHSVSNLRRVGIAELEQRLGVDRSTIWRWYRAGKFPAPHFLGERRAWFLAEVEAWELQRMARSDGDRQGGKNLRPAGALP